MSQGLQQVVQNASTPANAGFQINILDELGLNRQEAVFKSRTMALTDPKKYAAERESYFTGMKTEVAKSYADTKAALDKSGLGMADVQRLAINAANNTYATLNAILETQFPSGSTELSVQTEAKDKFPGMVSAPAAAPRRRAAPRKSRAKKK